MLTFKGLFLFMYMHSCMPAFACICTYMYNSCVRLLAFVGEVVREDRDMKGWRDEWDWGA